MMEVKINFAVLFALFLAVEVLAGPGTQGVSDQRISGVVVSQDQIAQQQQNAQPQHHYVVVGGRNAGSQPLILHTQQPVQFATVHSVGNVAQQQRNSPLLRKKVVGKQPHHNTPVKALQVPTKVVVEEQHQPFIHAALARSNVKGFLPVSDRQGNTYLIPSSAIQVISEQGRSVALLDEQGEGRQFGVGRRRRGGAQRVFRPRRIRGRGRPRVGGRGRRRTRRNGRGGGRRRIRRVSRGGRRRG